MDNPEENKWGETAATQCAASPAFAANRWTGPCSVTGRRMAMTGVLFRNDDTTNLRDRRAATGARGGWRWPWPSNGLAGRVPFHFFGG